MGIFGRISTLVKAHVNDILDKAVDMNSIPVLKQYIRELEVAISDNKHQAAVAAASVTTLSNQHDNVQREIDQATVRGKAFMSKTPPDEANARLCASHITDLKTELASFDEQITTAKATSEQMDAFVAKLDEKHRTIMTRLRILETKDGSSKALDGAVSSLKRVEPLLSDSADNPSVENIEGKINAHYDASAEEFKRTMADATPPPDPLKDQAIDDVMASFK